GSALRSRCAASLLSSLHPALLPVTVVRPCGITVTPLSRQRDISRKHLGKLAAHSLPGARRSQRAARAECTWGSALGQLRPSGGEGFRVPAVEHLPHPARSGGHVDVAQSGATVESIDDGIYHPPAGAHGAGP